jgi:hypothetical protein
MERLQFVRNAHDPTPIVAFSQFADTASAAFSACVSKGGVALVSGHGARVASGRVTVDEIVRGFDVESSRSKAMPLDLLITTDVLSEGLSLRRAGVLVHLDLPWTIARLEQRVGRLRRPGSIHRNVAVYAIGPPVAARELTRVVRALQRKARLSSAVTGIEELSALPLLGQRLTKATSMLSRHGDSLANEDLRQLLASWLEPSQHSQAVPAQATTIALVSCGASQRLLAVTPNGVAENPAEVLRAARAITTGVHSETGDWRVELAAIEKWLDEQRSRAIAQPATDNPSDAHAGVLRALQSVIAASPRSERVALVRRVERCRQLVLSARGIGAELALGRFLKRGGPIDLDRLEQLLGSRMNRVASPEEFRLVSLLSLSCGYVRGFLAPAFSAYKVS